MSPRASSCEYSATSPVRPWPRRSHAMTWCLAASAGTLAAHISVLSPKPWVSSSAGPEPCVSWCRRTPRPYPPRVLDLPPVRLPDSAAQLRADVRAFLAEQDFTPRCDSWATAWGRSPELTRALGERGWLGMTIPAEYGGGGRSPLERFVVIEELLAAGAPVSAHWVPDRQTAPSLLRFGTEAQRRRFLPAIARGECSFAIGMSEPGSGSDLASVSTRASRVDGGWSIDGLKTWTGGADVADFFVVCAGPATPGTTATPA